MNGFRELNHNELYQIDGGSVKSWLKDRIQDAYDTFVEILTAPPKKRVNHASTLTPRNGFGPVHP